MLLAEQKGCNDRVLSTELLFYPEKLLLDVLKLHHGTSPLPATLLTCIGDPARKYIQYLPHLRKTRRVVKILSSHNGAI
jgi:hypothetical protein